MKKTILLLSLSLIFSMGHSQITAMNGAASTTVTVFPVDLHFQAGQIGTVQITTSSNFNGTTTTDTLEFSIATSPGATDWSYVKDNSGNVVAWTLTGPSTPSRSYTATFQTTAVLWYRIIHNKGNASAGNEKILFYLK